MSDQNERALVARLRDRDELALAELASTYGQRIFQLAFRCTRNHEDAEEVVQDVLLKVFRKIDAFRGDSTLSSWVYRITFNTAMSRMRRLKAMRAAEMSDIEIGTAANDDAPAAFDPPDCSDLADASVLKSQLRERLALAVVGLPEIYRAPVILRDFNGLSTEEASTKLQIKDQTLKSRLHRGRMLLRARLADFADGLAMRSDSADVLRAFYSRSTYVARSSNDHLRIADSNRTRSRAESAGATRDRSPVGCSVTGIIADPPGEPSSRPTATRAACTRGVRVNAVRTRRAAAPPSA